VVTEPVQVYLETADRERLERLARQFDTTKSDILRRGLAAVERELLDPASHPILRLIGMAQGERPDAPSFDPGRDHDKVLGESEIASWGRPGRLRRPRGR
jgi:hypothetical protein